MRERSGARAVASRSARLPALSGHSPEGSTLRCCDSEPVIKANVQHGPAGQRQQCGTKLAFGALA